MQLPPRITSPDHPALDDLCRILAAEAVRLDDRDEWPAEALRLCGEYGVYRWFLPEAWGGLAWSEADLVRGYLRLSAASLVVTFILTQRSGACSRIVGSENAAVQDRWLFDLASGAAFATVGISHLTTSRRHLAKPVLTARHDGSDFILDGISPWVTGAPAADMVVLGATLDDGRQILAAVDTDRPGFVVPPPPRLVGLSASMTGAVHLSDVRIPGNCVLAGPIENVMQAGKGAGTGGLQTSTLAVGLSHAAIDYLEAESIKRPDLTGPGAELRREQLTLSDNLLALADGEAVCTSEDLRTRANSLVLRATQAALGAAKGTGYVVGHPAGRWCREALFFLVWSCPQAVLSANLCELAGIEG
ncbi:MAG TPA: acyl-CoA dehydrogenase family protein [Pirellulales bacterium]|nr:acyl-CoA dehydrogenase family protein [Pirellulales bacterium]